MFKYDPIFRQDFVCFPQMRLWRDGQSDGKGGAFATAFALRVNPATVHLNNRLPDGEPEAETFAPFFELRT